jgi:S-adenosylmethionine:tRNA ribosyltransferase-isomerase
VTARRERPQPPAAPAPLPTSAFDYELPDSLIAHHPTPARDASRLLVVQRDTGALEHRIFRDVVELIEPGDVLVLNETRVIPARLLGRRPGGGEAEIVLLHAAATGSHGSGPADHRTAATAAHPDQHERGPATAVPQPDQPERGSVAALTQPDRPAAADADWPPEWVALVRPGGKLRAGRVVSVGDALDVEILQMLPDGTRLVRLHTPLAVRDAVERYGRLPLPPYIQRAVEPADAERYQTVFARQEGSVAAPTAGLHFTPALLDTLRQRGVTIATVVLHVGVGTFRPVDVEDPAEHDMHAEWYEVTASQAARMNDARQRGGRLWAVGTTVTRTLESVVDRSSAAAPALIRPGSGWTRLFIRPGFEFRAVDRLVTNFHLPRSTLLMLVSAFAGHDRVMATYAEAVRRQYRFFSYGDAMVIL